MNVFRNIRFYKLSIWLSPITLLLLFQIINFSFKSTTMANVINWFEIPAKNFDRACEFYSKVLSGEIHKMDAPAGVMMGFLPGSVPDAVGGAIVQGEGYEPSSKGSVVYLNGGEDLSGPLSKVEKAGGKILVPKTSIGENGFIAQFVDTEGNRIAFHSKN